MKIGGAWIKEGSGVSMMPLPPIPIVVDLVLLGGGHAHLQVLKGFMMKPMPGVRLTLISKDAETPYSGMLPGDYEFGECHIDLQPLARLAGARFIKGSVCTIDSKKQLVYVEDEDQRRLRLEEEEENEGQRRRSPQITMKATTLMMTETASNATKLQALERVGGEAMKKHHNHHDHGSNDNSNGKSEIHGDGWNCGNHSNLGDDCDSQSTQAENLGKVARRGRCCNGTKIRKSSRRPPVSYDFLSINTGAPPLIPPLLIPETKWKSNCGEKAGATAAERIRESSAGAKGPPLIKQEKYTIDADPSCLFVDDPQNLGEEKGGVTSGGGDENGRNCIGREIGGSSNGCGAVPSVSASPVVSKPLSSTSPRSSAASSLPSSSLPSQSPSLPPPSLLPASRESLDEHGIDGGSESSNFSGVKNHYNEARTSAARNHMVALNGGNTKINENLAREVDNVGHQVSKAAQDRCGKIFHSVSWSGGDTCIEERRLEDWDVDNLHDTPVVAVKQAGKLRRLWREVETAVSMLSLEKDVEAIGGDAKEITVDAKQTPAHLLRQCAKSDSNTVSINFGGGGSSCSSNQGIHSPPYHVVILGGGAAGVEFALCASYRLARILDSTGTPGNRVEISLVTASSDILTTLNARTRARVHHLFRDRQIVVRSHTRVIGVRLNMMEDRGKGTNSSPCCEDGRPVDQRDWCVRKVPAPSLRASSGESCGPKNLLKIGGVLVVEFHPPDAQFPLKGTLSFNACFCCSGVISPLWLRSCDIDLDETGFVKTSATLQALNHANIFAAGDVASIVGAPRPKAGVFAVRSGPILLENLRNIIQKKRLRHFQPQSNFLHLLSAGGGHAIMEKGGVTAEGRWVWKLKDWIDKKWMEKFQLLPDKFLMMQGNWTLFSTVHASGQARMDLEEKAGILAEKRVKMQNRIDEEGKDKKRVERRRPFVLSVSSFSSLKPAPSCPSMLNAPSPSSLFLKSETPPTRDEKMADVIRNQCSDNDDGAENYAVSAGSKGALRGKNRYCFGSPSPPLPKATSAPLLKKVPKFVIDAFTFERMSSGRMDSRSRTDCTTLVYNCASHSLRQRDIVEELRMVDLEGHGIDMREKESVSESVECTSHAGILVTPRARESVESDVKKVGHESCDNHKSNECGMRSTVVGRNDCSNSSPGAGSANAGVSGYTEKRSALQALLSLRYLRIRSESTPVTSQPTIGSGKCGTRTSTSARSIRSVFLSLAPLSAALEEDFHVTIHVENYTDGAPEGKDCLDAETINKRTDWPPNCRGCDKGICKSFQERDLHQSKISQMDVARPSQMGENSLSIDASRNAAEKTLQSLAVGMRCGGCGSKVGGSILRTTMSRLQKDTGNRPEIILGIDTPDDCGMFFVEQPCEETMAPLSPRACSHEAFLSSISSLSNPSLSRTMVSSLIPPSLSEVSPSTTSSPSLHPPTFPLPNPCLLVQSTDFLKSFIDDPYVFGRVAANHALSDCHAVAAEPLTAVVTCVIPVALEKKMEDQLFELMSGIKSVLEEDNCTLIGGHTSEGLEFGVGVTVTGRLRQLSTIARRAISHITANSAIARATTIEISGGSECRPRITFRWKNPHDFSIACLKSGHGTEKTKEEGQCDILSARVQGNSRNSVPERCSDDVDSTSPSSRTPPNVSASVGFRNTGIMITADGPNTSRPNHEHKGSKALKSTVLSDKAPISHDTNCLASVICPASPAHTRDSHITLDLSLFLPGAVDPSTGIGIWYVEEDPETTAEANQIDEGHTSCDISHRHDRESFPKSGRADLTTPLSFSRLFCLRKGSILAAPGQLIVLTKPIGAGVILAADMRGRAKSRWVLEALKIMQQSNRAAAGCFIKVGATGCTDVTGFGLLGHLSEMIFSCRRLTAKELIQDQGKVFSAAYSCSESRNNSDFDPPDESEHRRLTNGSGRRTMRKEIEGTSEGGKSIDKNGEALNDNHCGRRWYDRRMRSLHGASSHSSVLAARVWLDAIPVLEGARDCLAMGIASTLAPSNRKMLNEDGIFCNSCEADGTDGQEFEHPNYGLLFDPQTGGGLIAFVPQENAVQCVAELRSRGYTYATCVGRLISVHPH